VDQEESEQNKVDGMKKGADSIRRTTKLTNLLELWRASASSYRHRPITH